MLSSRIDLRSLDLQEAAWQKKDGVFIQRLLAELLMIDVTRAIEKLLPQKTEERWIGLAQVTADEVVNAWRHDNRNTMNLDERYSVKIQLEDGKSKVVPSSQLLLLCEGLVAERVHSKTAPSYKSGFEDWDRRVRASSLSIPR